jgi:glycosyltransferase involved in cell wall biosynthesis
MHILQVCNVGNICGGTAACAWSVTHALADHQHTVVFLTRPTTETMQAFKHCQTIHKAMIDDSVLKKNAPDILILHNTTSNKIQGHGGFYSIQYHHSVGDRASATKHVACSKWLMKQTPQVQNLLYQPIPRPCNEIQFNRELSDELIIGRLCTPILKKWPQALLPLYERLAGKFPEVSWEFVGTPEKLKAALLAACQGRCEFLSAGMDARHHFWRWQAMLYHHPTITESFGRTVAEAMRAGCIPIVDSRGGFLEQITHSESGFLCENIETFEAAIQAILDRNQRRKMSQQAIAVSNERFSLEAFYNQFRQLLIEESTLLVQG